MKKDDLALLAKTFVYNAATGALTRIISNNNGAYLGHVSTTRVGFNRKVIPASHICWALHHKKWPSRRLYHINKDHYDNRISNLKEGGSE